jgi:hypothetical protein
LENEETILQELSEAKDGKTIYESPETKKRKSPFCQFETSMEKMEDLQLNNRRLS